MSLAHRLTAAVFCFAITWLAGCCVGPMTCGPAGDCGPVAFGSPCDGCGECEGCGELYIDPWINHPADCCDPCDRCGNYNGQSCGKCRSVFAGVCSLWGYRCDAGCDDCGDAACGGGCALAVTTDPCCDASCGGCDASCGGCDSSCGGCDACCSPGSPYATDGEIVGGSIVRIHTEPTLAKPIVRAPYKPHRTRKIFKPRPSVATDPQESSDY